MATTTRKFSSSRGQRPNKGLKAIAIAGFFTRIDNEVAKRGVKVVKLKHHGDISSGDLRDHCNGKGYVLEDGDYEPGHLVFKVAKARKS